MAGRDRDGSQLRNYWTRTPEGLAKWVKSPHPFTALVRHLQKHMTREQAEGLANRYYHRVFGYYPGSDRARVAHGKPPKGKKVGPG